MDINKKVLNEVSKGAQMGMDAIKFVSDKVSEAVADNFPQHNCSHRKRQRGPSPASAGTAWSFHIFLKSILPLPSVLPGT